MLEMGTPFRYLILSIDLRQLTMSKLDYEIVDRRPGDLTSYYTDNTKIKK